MYPPKEDSQQVYESHVANMATWDDMKINLQ